MKAPSTSTRQQYIPGAKTGSMPSNLSEPMVDDDSEDRYRDYSEQESGRGDFMA
jgi:hypothetical protein